MSQVLITGATGTVGREVAAALTSSTGTSCTIKAAVRDVTKAAPTLPTETDVVAFDFLEPETFDTALDGIQRCFLVRPPALATPQQDMAPFLDAMVEVGVEHVVFLSLLGVEHNRRTPHYRIEQLIRQREMAYTFLRPGFFMQNLNTFYRDDIRLHDEITIPAGRGKTGFIDVRDIAAVAAKVLTEAGHAGAAYELTGAEALDYFEVAAIMSDVLNRTITYTKPSPRAYRRRMRARGLPEDFIKVMTKLYIPVRLGLAGQTTEEVGRLLGRPPMTMRQYVEDYRSAWVKPTQA
jgi:uncharacterized protein YbjT (DUF2867 family)